MLAARACALLLVLGGCLAGGYRYIDVPGSADTVRGHLEQRARADGMLVYHERGATLLKADPPAREILPPAVTTPDQAPLRSRYRYEIIPRLVAVARFHSLAPERTRIELSGNLERAKVIVPDPPGVVVTPVDTFGWSEWPGVGIDVAVGAGIVSDPEYHASGSSPAPWWPPPAARSATPSSTDRRGLRARAHLPNRATPSDRGPGPSWVMRGPS